MSFFSILHRSLISAHRDHENPGVNVRRWLAVGICGALFVAALSPLWDAWAINTAGILVNRAVAQEDIGPGSAAEDDLNRAMNLMESAAGRGPHTAAREIPMWRTYGIAASLIPSDHAYELLLRSQNAGRLDRIGELWLGEVASSTSHWDEARKVYVRVDASNFLINRAETSLKAGELGLAIIQFDLAKASLHAAAERATARALLLDRTGNQPSAVSELMQKPGERATSLYRIGRGMMNADQPLQAVPILEEALEAATTASPGAVTQQSIMLALGLALAKTLPSPSDTEGSPPHSYFALDATGYATVKAKIRIRTLAYQGLGFDITASACVQAGRILLLAGDDEQAAALLNKALELDPLLAEAYMVLGSWEEDRGLVLAARDLYRRGSAELPGNAELAGAYGITSYKSLPPQDALPLLEHAADMDTRDPYVFAFLGDCYADLGMTNQAVASYKEGLRKFPGSEPLNERLSGLAKSNRLLP